MQNLHTHSSFDHGIDTPEEIVQKAIKTGFDSIGFSGHAYQFYCDTFTMSPEGTIAYKKDVLRLKKKYAEKIKIYLGLEFDMYSDTPVTGYEYIIGACHYLKMGDDYVSIDRDEEHYRRIINEYFDSDGMKLVKEYYRQITFLPEYAEIDVLAHFDLITKNIDRCCFFDYNSKEYLSAAVEALTALRESIPLFEVNTGGIVRGYRKTPYPMLSLIKEMKRLGFGAIITSDCHDATYLDAYFDDAAALLREGGFEEKYILTDNGWMAEAL